MTTGTDNARSQAQAQLEHIRELMEWLDHAHDEENMRSNCTFFESECISAARDYGADAHDVDAATEAIHENALSVEVRGGWQMVGAHDPDGLQAQPAEYRILLCAGGPAVRIVGELNEHGEPESARLEYQDWGTPWTRYNVNPFEDKHSNADVETTLLRYASQFYFSG